MSERADQRPIILLLGTGHWSNPGHDYHSPEYDDMLAPRRQREIASCLERLSRFAPTRIALEGMANETNQLNEEYQRYRNGSLALMANERHQIGFRLAAMLGHDRIHCIDWHDMERPIGWDEAIAFAQANGQDHLVPGFTRTADEQEQAAMRSRIAGSNVTELLLDSSDLEGLANNHRVYIDLAQVGNGNDYIGADVVLRWYERNMKIFVNLSRIVSTPNERVLVLIGGGHLPLLSHFVEGAGQFSLASVSTYLSPEWPA